MPVVLLFVGGLETLQTASIVGGAPLLIVALLLCMSIVKVARFDLRHQPLFEHGEIHVHSFPHPDPWTEVGSWEPSDHSTHGPGPHP